LREGTRSTFSWAFFLFPSLFDLSFFFPFFQARSARSPRRAITAKTESKRRGLCSSFPFSFFFFETFPRGKPRFHRKDLKTIADSVSLSFSFFLFGPPFSSFFNTDGPRIRSHNMVEGQIGIQLSFRQPPPFSFFFLRRPLPPPFYLFPHAGLRRDSLPTKRAG